MLRDTLFINDQGHLDVGGADCTELAREFGTPLYVLDEDCIRKVCRDYRRVLDAKYPDSLICYASKAFSAQAIYTIVGQEGCGADVVSAGEMYTAMTAGFDMSKTYFHGSNKLPHEVDMALRGVHAIVADGESDLELLADAAERTGIRPRVLLRINPGIEAHTHEFVQTTRIDSKFGVSVADGTALALVGKFIESDTMDFLGVHCHIGSQIFELAPFRSAVDKVTDFCVEVKRKLGFDIREINFGGGYGIRYVESDKPYDPSVYVDAIVTKLLECIESKGLRAPHLVLEPGRSIVGEAGITLYTVGAIKTIPNVKKYIGVDGGMFDNPRYALYGSQYTAMLANRASEPAAEKVTIAGKCCESGDMVAADVMLPPARRGDIVAVLSTGAYNYSMASHYNRNAIPPVVLVKDGAAEYIVRPETLEDLIARDVIPSRLKGVNMDIQTATGLLSEIARILVLILALTLHEWAHAFAAYKSGDPTAKLAGRLTVNPLKHMDPIGFGMLLLTGVGFAKPVPVNPYNYKHPKRDGVFVALAGVTVNFILAFVFAGIYTAVAHFAPVFATESATGANLYGYFVFRLLRYMMIIDVSLMIFNLFPIYPLDGFRIVEAATRADNPYRRFMYRYGNRVLLGLLVESVLMQVLFEATGQPVFLWLDLLGNLMSTLSGYVLWPIEWIWNSLWGLF